MKLTVVVKLSRERAAHLKFTDEQAEAVRLLANAGYEVIDSYLEDMPYGHGYTIFTLVNEEGI
jgi:hypothetical protein